MRNFLEDSSVTMDSVPAKRTTDAIFAQSRANAHPVILERSYKREVFTDSIHNTDCSLLCDDACAFFNSVSFSLVYNHVVMLRVIADFDNLCGSVGKTSEIAFGIDSCSQQAVCYVFFQGFQLCAKLEVFQGKGVVVLSEREVVGYAL